MTREFHLGDILSITTGHMLSLRGIEGVYDILDYIHGCSLWTHQLPRAITQATPWLLRQHPQLRDLPEPEFPEGDAEMAVRAWLATQTARFGEFLAVEPFSLADRVVREPLSELLEMAPSDSGVIVLESES